MHFPRGLLKQMETQLKQYFKVYISLGQGWANFQYEQWRLTKRLSFCYWTYYQMCAAAPNRNCWSARNINLYDIRTRVCKDSENTDSGFTRQKFQDSGIYNILFLCQLLGIIKYLNRYKTFIISILSFILHFWNNLEQNIRY